MKEMINYVCISKKYQNLSIIASPYSLNDKYFFVAVHSSLYQAPNFDLGVDVFRVMLPCAHVSSLFFLMKL